MSTPNLNRRKREPAPSGPEIGHAGWRLRERILALSCADDWATANAEWELAAVWFDWEEPGLCLCGKVGITEICLIVNRQNGHTAIVGNVCVGQFMGIPAGPLFRSFRRIIASPAAGLSPDAARHAHARGWVSDHELRLCLETFGKVGLSPRQSAWRQDINRRVARRLGEASYV